MVEDEILNGEIGGREKTTHQIRRKCDMTGRLDLKEASSRLLSRRNLNPKLLKKLWLHDYKDKMTHAYYLFYVGA